MAKRSCKYLKSLLLFAGGLLFVISCTEVEMKQFSRQVLTGVSSGDNTPLTLGDIDAGLREALRVGSERVVTRVGRKDGFNLDLNIHIPLPRDLEKAGNIARKFGLEKQFADLELRLNRAAEKAAPLAKELFLQAIGEMTLADVREIFNGPDDGATRYFENKMSPSLALLMGPIVDQTLDQVGAVRVYKQVLGEYRKIPFAPEIDADLTDYVVAKGMGGIFLYLAEEEAAIRRNPAKRTTEILRRVFSE